MTDGSETDAVPSGNGHAGPGSPKGERVLRWSLIVVAALAVAGVTLFVLTRSGTHPAMPHGAAASTAPTPRTPFLLPDPSITISRLGSSSGEPVATALAGQIQTALSSFYDQAFMDPQTWTNGTPSSAWDIFAPELRAGAQRDADSLTLGVQPARVTGLRATDATLSIRVLVDGSGKARLALADVGFEATGTVVGGEPIIVTSRATFVFRVVSGQWLVVAYPVANTEVTAEPVPSAPASASPTSGASP